MSAEIKSKIANIKDEVNSQILRYPDNENLHPMECKNYTLSKNYTFFVLMPPTISMMTVQYLLPNYNFDNIALFNRVNVGDRVIKMETIINKKIMVKSLHPNTEKQSNVFNSQVTFHVVNGDNIFKIKFFNGVGGNGEVQIPGVKDIYLVKSQVDYLRKYINNQLNSEIGEPFGDEIKGFSSRSMLRLPNNIAINFRALVEVLNEVQKEQRARGKNKLIRSGNCDPVFDVVWPICDVDCNIGRKKCWIYIFTPIYGCNTIKCIRVDFTGKAKNPANGMWEYSILMSGRAQIRHRRYVYHFLWELFGKYQDRIFYNETEHIQKQLIEDYMDDIELLEYLEANDNSDEEDDELKFDL